MEQFTSEVFSSPKGILFYISPGTGKSAILLKMCEVLELKLFTNLNYSCSPSAETKEKVSTMSKKEY
jgi:SpoVK/Ycf46/Vps4 family AAA+-type ATPase